MFIEIEEPLTEPGVNSAATTQQTSPAIQLISSSSSNRRLPLLLRLNSSLRKALVRCFMDTVLLLGAAIGTEMVLRAFGPRRSGFSCDDESIRKPFVESSIPIAVAMTYGLLMSAALVLYVEHKRLRHPATASELVNGNELHCGESRMLRLGVRYAHFKGYLLVALVKTSVLTSLTKFYVGRLRPHFFDVCRPSVNCSSMIAAEHDGRHYVPADAYHCLAGDHTPAVTEARLSFWSGHTSMTMCATVFVFIYVQCRLRPMMRSRAAAPLLQTILFAICLIIAYSRVRDNWHHATDVLAGVIVGAIVGTFSAMVNARLSLRRTNADNVEIGDDEEPICTRNGMTNGDEQTPLFLRARSAGEIHQH